MSTREWIFVVIAVLAVYLVFQLIRAMQVKGDGDAPAAEENTALARLVVTGQSDSDPATEAPPDAPMPAAQGAPQPSPVSDDFAHALEIRQLRRDVSQLREVQDAQRNAIAELRAIIDGQAAALAAARAAQSISPMYSEALGLAKRGMSADVIAERCSISVAEAELVQSLAQEPDTNDTEGKA